MQWHADPRFALFPATIFGDSGFYLYPNDFLRLVGVSVTMEKILGNSEDETITGSAAGTS